MKKIQKHIPRSAKVTNARSRALTPSKQNTKGVAAEVKAEAKLMLKNGLGEALGFGPTSIGTQLNQTQTLFLNNRWYFISNMRQLLSEIYVEHGIVQTLVDVPVDDALRGGVEIISGELDPDEIKDLVADMEREQDLKVIGQGIKWTRLYGGGGVIIVTDQNPQEPFDIKKLKPDSPLIFRAVDMWELFWDKQNVEGYDAQIQENDFEFYNYYALKLHKSRVMKMKGLEAPSFVRPRLRGWGFSVAEPLVNSINQYLKANNVSFEVMDEFKLDIFKITGLNASLLSDEGMAAIQRRVQLANMQKNYQNALTMDKEDDYDHKQLTFSGLSDVMKEIRRQVAADVRMPVTKLFGTSDGGGLGNSDQNDMENYNSMVESQVREKIKYEIIRVIEIRCQKKFGYVPADIQIKFKPLRELTAEQEETVKTQKFARLMQAVQAGLMTPEEFKDACNKDNLLGIEIDTSIDQLPVLGAEDKDDSLNSKGKDKEDKEKDLDESANKEEPAANREDTSKIAPLKSGGN